MRYYQSWRLESFLGKRIIIKEPSNLISLSLSLLVLSVRGKPKIASSKFETAKSKYRAIEFVVSPLPLFEGRNGITREIGKRFSRGKEKKMRDPGENCSNLIVN